MGHFTLYALTKWNFSAVEGFLVREREQNADKGLKESRAMAGLHRARRVGLRTGEVEKARSLWVLHVVLASLDLDTVRVIGKI